MTDKEPQQANQEIVSTTGKLLLISGVFFYVLSFVLGFVWYSPKLLGTAYMLGIGVSQDTAAAIKWYRLSAERGYKDAQSMLGTIYATGLGVPRDYAEAVKWYKLAAERGDTDAESGLGSLYMQGKGVSQDFIEAAKWFEQAANKGDALAQGNLGLLYLQGQGVSQDFEQALKWLRLAAAQGRGEALATLGSIYMHGTGTPIDYAEALKWLEKPSSEGTLPCKNCLAWLLATCPDDHIRNGHRALTLAKEVVAKDAAPENLDTLAAAYAAVENFEEAARIQEKLVAKLENDDTASPSDITQYRARLQAYKEKRAWRMP